MDERHVLDHSLELFNSLAFVFVATEITLLYNDASRITSKKDKASGPGVRRLLWQLGGIAVVNLLFSAWSLVLISSTSGTLFTGVHTVQSSTNSVLSGIAHAPATGLRWVGTDLLVTVLLTVCGALLAFGVCVVKQIEPRRVHVGYVLAAGATLFVVIKLLEVDTDDWHTPAAKFVLSVMGFSLVCFYDSRRFRPELTATEFVRKVARSCAIVLPMFPFLAVACATFMFFVVSVVENLLRMDPSFLNMPIYYGTFYGPLWFLYAEVKRWCVYNRSSFLPVHMGSSSKTPR